MGKWHNTLPQGTGNSASKAPSKGTEIPLVEPNYI